jgi:phenol 2-monooxygenase (NADPH)
MVSTGGEEGITKEVVIQEAKEALKPFEVVFGEIKWWTIYVSPFPLIHLLICSLVDAVSTKSQGIGQRIADSFSGKSDRVFLAGDACHTHSSGSAQGLNTGVHE